ncbi:hypothetical protein A6E15_11280 [Natrinema saccharevitans]|uniref:Uncharacterized protein n=1 Tax=Natrinema saccharevitans TaxID=301967 RepID=A0A1S8AXD6_9EURY|nr:hypothetical protein [Natrinema saccharevitans]OLZ41528.1 hypothetical protein A6E15_11280 [Natrinema saccharevitans]
MEQPLSKFGYTWRFVGSALVAFVFIASFVGLVSIGVALAVVLIVAIPVALSTGTRRRRVVSRLSGIAALPRRPGGGRLD